MGFFAGLVSFYLLTWLASLVLPTGTIPAGMAGIAAAAIMFVTVGIAHFAKPEKLEAMIPEAWPYKRAANYISGLVEIACGIALLFAATRIYAAWALIALLVFIFPANIHVAMKKPDGYNISRLFFQPVYIAWIWWFCITATR